ncbi:MAG: gliding motility-associated C-terminal domain-containing protein [Bacteroidota bacterium]
MNPHKGRLSGMYNFCLTAFFILFATVAFAQPSNEECDSATPISDPSNWCSEVNAFTNVGATASGFGPAGCFTNNSHDVWFSFVAVATDVNVTINGASGAGGGGTLNQPEVALYTGSCSGTLNNIQCQTDDGLNNIVELYRGSLVVGQTYWIRVDGRNDNTGSFQLCIQNYNPQTEPGSDCIAASILCDQSPFSVASVVGPGSDPDEAGGSSCLGGLGGNSESNSTWFTWTAATTGTLEFTLTPTNPADDLDFVVYELPSGVLNCSDKIERLCMAAGDFNFPSPCMGPTGLRASSTDTSEPPGCGGGNDNWLAPLDMVQGTSYALLVNNFTSTGNGFSIEFGGSGDFLGPEVDFNNSPAQICAGEAMTFTDNSSFALGSIIGWEWNFGVGAMPQTASTQGPHNVFYDTPGTKFVTLTIETSLGCILTEIETVIVEPCCNSLNPLVASFDSQDVLCADNLDGSIDLSVSSNFPTFSFAWSDGANTEDRDMLVPGIYDVTITDGIGCEEIFSIPVDGPPPFDLQSSITMPTCNGGMDGAVNLNLGGATPPYTFEWFDGGGALVSSNEDLLNIPIGDYTLNVTDANGCQITADFDVNELELLLDPNVEVIVQPSCNGFSNGSITINVANGLPPYAYDFNDGNGFVPSNSLVNIPAGTYNVTVRDQNFCFGNFMLDVGEPDPLAIAMDTVDVSCFGYTDGAAVATVSGGTMPYSYLWSHDMGADSMNVDNLAPGDYSLTVTDANGCTITSGVFVEEPPEFIVEEVIPLDNVCFGASDGALAVTGMGGVGPYTYSADGETFQVDSVLTGLAAGTYTVSIMDANGCLAFGTGTITEPFEIIVDARPDQTIDLGYSADIQAVVNTLDDHTYSWTPAESLSCADCPEPTAMPVNTTTYWVTILTEFGCTATDSVTITVNKVRPVYIPNAFTPNFDGVNDQWVIYGAPAVGQIRTVKVFNRWGDIVYGANNIPANSNGFGWDGTFRGKRVNPGVFVYIAEVEFIDGEVLSYTGDITLIK